MKTHVKIIFICIAICLIAGLVLTDDRIKNKNKQSHLNKNKNKQNKNFRQNLNVTENKTIIIKSANKRLSDVDTNSTINNFNYTTDEIAESKIYSGNCFMKMHNWFYDLNPISPAKSDFTLISKEGKEIKFNLCHNVQNSNCSNLANSTNSTNLSNSGLIVENENCNVFASEYINEKIWNLEIDNSTNQEKIVLNLPMGKQCSLNNIENINHTVTVEITCNPNITQNKILNEEEFSTEKCENTIKMVSPFACKTVKYTIWYKQFGVNKYIIGSILGLIGVFFILFGNAYFEFTAALIVGISSGLIVKSVINLQILHCLVIGLIISFILFKLVEYIGIAIAIIFGVGLANLIFPILIKIVPGVAESNVFYYGIVLICVIIVVYLKKFTQAIMIIIMTSFVGAYLSVRGLSICLGGFPDESYTSILLHYKEYGQFTRAFRGAANLYLVAIFVLFCFGLVYQGALVLFKEDKVETIKASEDNEEQQKLKEDKNDKKENNI